jgi:heme oxygenase
LEQIETDKFYERENNVMQEIENEQVKIMNEDIGSMMGRLDITEGSNLGGESISKPLNEGRRQCGSKSEADRGSAGYDCRC